MIIFFLIVALLIIGIVLLVAGIKRDCEMSSYIGVAFTILFGMATLITGMEILTVNCNIKGQIANLNAEREALVWQIENDTYDGSSNAIGIFNGNVLESKIGLENDWISWFYSPAYNEIETIVLQ